MVLRESDWYTNSVDWYTNSTNIYLKALYFWNIRFQLNMEHSKLHDSVVWFKAFIGKDNLNCLPSAQTLANEYMCMLCCSFIRNVIK